jgi:isoprenylcysteine carboxyl methyltransferase (ICMT) family protein YpbQ
MPLFRPTVKFWKFEKFYHINFFVIIFETFVHPFLLNLWYTMLYVSGIAIK